MKTTFLRPENEVTEAWGHRKGSNQPTVTLTVNNPACSATVKSIIAMFRRKGYAGVVFS